MKNYIIIICISLFLFGCNKHPVKQQCLDYLKTIQDLEREISIMYVEEGQLKEELVNAREYISSLEEENSYYKDLNYKQ